MCQPASLQQSTNPSTPSSIFFFRGIKTVKVSMAVDAWLEHCGKAQYGGARCMCTLYLSIVSSAFEHQWQKRSKGFKWRQTWQKSTTCRVAWNGVASMEVLASVHVVEQPCPWCSWLWKWEEGHVHVLVPNTTIKVGQVACMKLYGFSLTGSGTLASLSLASPLGLVWAKYYLFNSCRFDVTFAQIVDRNDCLGTDCGCV